MKSVFVLGAVAVVASWGGVDPASDGVGGRHCTYERDVDVSVQGEGVSSLYIDSGSGDVVVEGRDDARGVVVRGTMCASEEEFLEILDVTATRSGDAVSLDTHYPRGDSWDRRSGNRTARIDLTIIVPSGTEIEITDGSGDIEVRGTGSITIEDGSGSLDIREIDGDVAIEDGSGGIDIRDVRGEVLLRDGSGSVEIQDVASSVRIVEDSSGSIAVARVGGDFMVGRDGSGSIRHSDVEGRVEVPTRRRRGKGLRP